VTEINWRDADLVHLFEVNFYTTASLRAFRYPALVHKLRSDTPVVVSTDDLYFTGEPALTARPRLYRLNHRTQSWLFDRADAIVAISTSVRENLTPQVDPAKIHVVHHGVDDRYRVTDPPQRTDPFVLHVSLASKRKNPGAVVEAARRLDVRFVIAGSGWDSHFQSTERTDNVELLGYVTEDELIDLYHDAAVFYFPTLHEGFGLPVLEAMAAGCAVVASDVYAVPELAGDAAVLHGPNDIDRHVDAIERLLDDHGQRHELAARAIDRSQRFSWKKTARETVEVYRSVLDEETS
jgi:glycosyltransferase involved in cell wall biosynthesis